MKIDENKLKEAIREKYGTQANFAKKMGLKEAAVSRAIKSQTARYLSKFKKGGIDIDVLLLDEEGKRKGNFEYQLKLAEKRIKELVALLEQKDNLLEQKDNLIKSYESVIKNQFKDKQ